jgi:O-antigen/teichoic acid export membrane protein
VSANVAREARWVVAGQCAVVLGGLALVRVLTEYLTPSQYGELALALTLAGLVNQSVTGGLAAGIARYYAVAAEAGDVRGYLRDARRLMGLATAVVGALLMLSAAWLIGSGRGSAIGLAVMVAIFAVVSGLGSAVSGIQNAARQRALCALHSGGEAWLRIAVVVLLLQALGVSTVVVVLAYVLSMLVATASQVFFVRRLGADAAGRVGECSWTGRIWAYSWPFSIFGLFTWLHQASDRWALQSFGSADQVGLYAVLFQLGYAPMGVAVGVAMNLLAPIFYQTAGQATDSDRNTQVHRMAWRSVAGCLGLTGVAVGVALLLHRPVFALLVAEEFRVLSYLLPWMLLAGGLFAAGQMLALKLMADLSTAAMTRAKVGTALLGVALNIVLARVMGVEGVVIAQVGFGLVYLVWMAALARHPKRGVE